MKTKELTQTALDTHVALVLGWKFQRGEAPAATPDCGHQMWYTTPDDLSWRCCICNRIPKHYSTDWNCGGPVIEVFRLALVPLAEEPFLAGTDPHPLALMRVFNRWRGVAEVEGQRFIATHRQPLRAAMEALVRSRNPDAFEAE